MMKAVITGAATGIGLKTAEALGKAGYEVFLTARTNEQEAAVRELLSSQGIKFHFFVCDATDEQAVNGLFEEIGKLAGHLDVLVNNVGGLGGRQRIPVMETSFMRDVMAKNFDSVFFATRAALPLLKKGKNASVINLSSIAVTSGGGPGASVYCASKGAVEGFTRALAKELGEFNIRVNAVSPGTIDTPFHAATDRNILESWTAGIVMKRLGQPEEVASVISFLASEQASFLTGEVIQVNGGQAFI